MHRSSCIVLAALLSTAAPAWCQSVLPTSFAGWKTTATQSFAPAAGPASASAKEYGFASGQRATYTRANETLNTTLYQFGDPSGAYGEYTYLQSSGMSPAGLGEQSVISPDRALVLVGNFVLDVQGRNLPSFDSDLKSLVGAIAPHGQKGLLPILTQDLPRTDLEDRSDRYVLGPATLDQLFPAPIGNTLGFSQGAEAELAKYRLAGHDVTLMIADYPTPQYASKKLIELQQQFDINHSKPDVSPHLYAKRSLTMIAFVAGASSEAEANQLLEQIHSNTELTWDEPSFQFSQPSISSIVVGTIVGTGIICLFALVSGLAFGGFRLVIKRALPDKVFDRSDQLQILQLGLSSKPINAEDFYGLGSTGKN